MPAQTPQPNTVCRAERRAARRGKPGRVERPDVPGARAATPRGAQGRRVNPIRRTGS
jgi:hypothetical protein